MFESVFNPAPYQAPAIVTAATEPVITILRILSCNAAAAAADIFEADVLIADT